MSSFASYSPIIAKVYKSRNIFLEILGARGYDTSDYAGFSVNEVHVMYNAVPKQLDMILENSTPFSAAGPITAVAPFILSCA